MYLDHILPHSTLSHLLDHTHLSPHFVSFYLFKKKNLTELGGGDTRL